jgi:hypothetical protein
MTKEQLIAMGLTEEQAEKVMESLNGAFVTKKRFDELNETKKQLDKDIAARDKQLEDLKKVDAAGLQAEIEKLQGQNKADKEAYDAQLKQLQLDSAVEKALTGANAKNIKAVKALLELGDAALDADGSIKGLGEQLKKLQESEDTKFLFNVESKPALKGMKPGETKDGSPGAGTQINSLEAAVKSHLEAN